MTKEELIEAIKNADTINDIDEIEFIKSETLHGTGEYLVPNENGENSTIELCANNKDIIAHNGKYL